MYHIQSQMCLLSKYQSDLTWSRNQSNWAQLLEVDVINSVPSNTNTASVFVTIAENHGS